MVATLERIIGNKQSKEAPESWTMGVGDEQIKSSVEANYQKAVEFLNNRKPDFLAYCQQITSAMTEKIFNALWEEVIKIVVDERIERVQTIAQIGKVLEINPYSKNKLPVSLFQEIATNTSEQRILQLAILHLANNKENLNPKIIQKILDKLSIPNRQDIATKLLYIDDDTQRVDEFIKNLGLYIDPIYSELFVENLPIDSVNEGIEAMSFTTTKSKIPTVMKGLESLFQKFLRKLSPDTLAEIDRLEIEDLKKVIRSHINDKDKGIHDITRVTVYLDEMFKLPFGMTRWSKVNESWDRFAFKGKNQKKFANYLIDSIFKLKEQFSKNGQKFEVLEIKPKLVLSGYSDITVKFMVDGKIYEVQYNLEKNKELKQIETPYQNDRKSYHAELLQNKNFDTLLNEYLKSQQKDNHLTKEQIMQKILSFENDEQTLAFKECFSATLNDLPDGDEKKVLFILKDQIDDLRKSTQESLRKSREIFSEENGILENTDDVLNLKTLLKERLSAVNQPDNLEFSQKLIALL